MSDSEAIEVVHQMMAARDHEEARTAALASSWSRRGENRSARLFVVTERSDPRAARRAFWREVAVYPLTLVCAAAYALLMAVAQ